MNGQCDIEYDWNVIETLELLRDERMPSKLTDEDVNQFLQCSHFVVGASWNEITPQDVRLAIIFFYRGNTRLCNHAIELWARITGHRKPTLTPQQIHQCNVWFHKVHQWYKQHRFTNRLPSQYCLARFLEFLGLDHLKSFVSQKWSPRYNLMWHDLCTSIQSEGHRVLKQQRHSILQSVSRMLLPELCNLIGAYARPRWTLGFCC